VKHKTFQRLIVTSGLAVWLGAGASALAKGKPGGGGPPSCTDLPVAITLDQTPGPGIYSDGNDLYEDGVDNVRAQILICGTGDATLNTNVSSRMFWFDLTDNLATNNETPGWASANATFPSSGGLNVRSLVNSICPYDPSEPPAASCTFTTTMGVSFTGPDRKDYGVRMVAVDETDPNHIGPRQDASWVNDPQMTSKVTVTYFPAADPGGERWEVQSEAGHVGTLIKQAKRNTQVNAGQFSMPASLTIRRK